MPEEYAGMYATPIQELMDWTMPPSKPLVEGLLSSGVYLLAGSPKIGKSWFALWLAVQISRGQPVWSFPTNSCTVLYLALEDTQKRLQKRLIQLYGNECLEEPLHFALEAQTADNGLERQLRTFVMHHPDTGLIVIDTLQKARGTCGISNAYASDYEVISRLKQLADERNLCILLVHHTRKMPDADPFHTISGTTGLHGAADGALVLHRENRLDHKAVLNCSSRDFPDQRLHLTFGNNGLWTLDEIEREVQPKYPPVLEQLAKVLPDHWTGTATELQSLLGIDILPNQLMRILNAYADQLLCDFHIRYVTKRTRQQKLLELHREA